MSKNADSSLHLLELNTSHFFEMKRQSSSHSLLFLLVFVLPRLSPFSLPITVAAPTLILNNFYFHSLFCTSFHFQFWAIGDTLMGYSWFYVYFCILNVDNVAAIVGGSPLSSGTRNSRVDHSVKNPHSPNPGVMSNTKHVQISTQKQETWESRHPPKDVNSLNCGI